VICWEAATNPQCLRIETTSEIHLYPYGYFCRASFSRDGNNDVIEIQFQETVVIAKGRGLGPLCDALARLGVERIKTCPEKYGAAFAEGFISNIEIKKMAKESQV
jgi:hypothetical protein